MRIGYPCINLTLAKQKIQVNRRMVKRTFQSKGLLYASELALKNVMDLEKVINWNIEKKFLLFRITSDLFPWMSEYELEQLPDFSEIQNVLAAIGKKAAEHSLRLTFHPGPFNVLASPNEVVVNNTLKELRQHGEILDLLNMPSTVYSKINIHIGGTYGDKAIAVGRFVRNYKKLSASARNRLTIENDDKENMFSVKELMQVHEQTGIPIVFDYFHHQFCRGGLSEEEAFKLAISTWGDITPVVHFSSSKKLYEDVSAQETAHANLIYSVIETYGAEVDIMLEAKGKELAVIDFLKKFPVVNV